MNEDQEQNSSFLNDFIENILPNHRKSFFLQAPNANVFDFLTNLLEIYQIELSDYLRSHAKDYFDDEVYKNRHIIEYLQGKIELLNLHSGEENNSSFWNRYTNSQITFIFYYLLEFFGVKTITLKKADITRFIHLVTNTKYETINKSDIYKKVEKLPTIHLNHETTISDLNTIRPLFEKYEFKYILNKIDSDISNYKEFISKRKKL